MKRQNLYGLAILGTGVLIADLWWLLAQTVGGELGPSSYISAGTYLFVFAAISLRWMHETAAALVGAVLIWLVHDAGSAVLPSLQIIGFEESMAFIGDRVGMPRSLSL